nr:hypothetical protein [Tanacetum cinerariifolium]
TLTTMASGVATQPQMIDDLCVRMSNLEYGTESTSDGITGSAGVPGQDVIIGLSQQVQTLQTTLHGAELQNQQLRTRVAEMESREGILMSYMLWMEERLTILEKRLSGPPSRTQ